MNSTYNMMQAIGAGPIILKQAINRSNRNANNLLDAINASDHLEKIKKLDVSKVRKS